MTETNMGSDIMLRRPRTTGLNAQPRHRSARVALIAAPLLLIATACGDDSGNTIGFHFSGKPQAGVPSQVVWEAHLVQSPDASYVDAGTFVVASSSFTSLTGLDASSGNVAFERRSDQLPLDLEGVLAFGGGRLLVGAHGDGGADGRVDAYDSATGNKVWSVALDLKDPLPVIVGDAVVVANHDAGQSTGHVHLYALADGKERWSAPVALGPVARPESNDHDRGAPLLAVDEQALTVQTGSGTSLAKIDLQTGAIAWEYDTGRPIVQVQALEAEGRVVVLTKAQDETDLKRRVEGLRSDTGQLVWSRETDDDTFVVNGDSIVTAVDFGGPWSSFDVSSGSTQWESYSDGSSIQAVSGNFAVTDGLSVFDLTTGEHMWSTGKFQAPGDVHVVGDVVVANSSSHKPTAYDVTTGKKLWAVEDGYVLEYLDQSNTVLTRNVDLIELRDVHTGTVLWNLTIGDKVGIRAQTDADGNLYIVLDKYRTSVATIIAITPPPA